LFGERAAMKDDDESFLGYCEIHSRTERALFSGAQIRRLLELADHKMHIDPLDLHDGMWLTMRSYLADPLIDRARERLRAGTVK
jgi:hypothetical protein